MKEVRLIIAGSRDFDNYNLLEKACVNYLDTIIQDRNIKVRIVSGCAKGADTLGELFARTFGYPIKKFPADWDKHGKAAGPIRNKQMAEYANTCIVFCRNKSRGSLNMVHQAMEEGISVNLMML